MTNIDYLLIGHATADLVGEGRTLGGTVTYATPVAHAMGCRVGIVTSAASNEPLFEKIRPYATLAVYAADHTTTFRNVYHEGGRTQYIYGLANGLDYDLLPVGWLDAPLVHLAPLVNEVPPEIVHRFRDQTVLLTPQGYMRRWGDDGQVHFKRWFDEDVLRAVDILVLSQQDIADAPELEQEYAQVVKWLFVTDGENGGAYYHRGERFTYDPYPVEEQDPTGAGDVFAGALLASLPLAQQDMHAAVRIAARLAAVSVTEPGLYLFSRDDPHITAARQAVSETRKAQ